MKRFAILSVALACLACLAGEGRAQYVARQRSFNIGVNVGTGYGGVGAGFRSTRFAAPAFAPTFAAPVLGYGHAANFNAGLSFGGYGRSFRQPAFFATPAYHQRHLALSRSFTYQQPAFFAAPPVYQQPRALPRYEQSFSTTYSRQSFAAPLTAPCYTPPAQTFAAPAPCPGCEQQQQQFQQFQQFQQQQSYSAGGGCRSRGSLGGY